jgi:hypothetical protein
MKLKDYIRSISHVTAPYYNGDIRKVLIRHWGWLNNRPWGVRADLRSADLSSANLRSANLRSANLRSADLSSANLRSANLSSADLRSADLSFANLRSANLRSADLSSADLSSADLRSADLRSAKCFCLNISKYQIIGTQSHIIIGCQRWEWGEDLDEKAVEFNLVDEWNRIKKAVYACTQAIGVSK